MRFVVALMAFLSLQVSSHALAEPAQNGVGAPILAALTRHYSPYLYVAPHIPTIISENALRNARPLAAGEALLAVADETAFHNGTVGVYFFIDGIVTKQPVGGPQFIPYAAMSGLTPKKGTFVVYYGDALVPANIIGKDKMIEVLDDVVRASLKGGDDQPAGAARGAPLLSNGAETSSLVVKGAQFEALPALAQLQEFYPARAQRMGVAGSAVMRCAIGADRRLSGCSILEETPPNWGFGEAALKLSPLFQLKPMAADGTPTAGRVFQTKIRFALRRPVPPPPPTPTPKSD